MKRFKKDQEYEHNFKELFEIYEKEYEELNNLTIQQIQELNKHKIFSTAQTNEKLMTYELEKIENELKKLIYKNIKDFTKRKIAINTLQDNLDDILITYLLNKNEYSKENYKKYLIIKYQTKLLELEKINKELYNLTEMFEEKETINFQFKLWNIFKNKIGQYTKTANKINKNYFQ